jgi:hypothetical protein
VGGNFGAADEIRRLIAMNTNQPEIFLEVLKTITSRSSLAWVYLPSNSTWSLQSKSATLVSDEVPQEFEDEPDAGVPQFAKRNHLMQVIPVATLQDIVSNALQQKPNATSEELFDAFNFFYKNDAFIKM